MQNYNSKYKSDLKSRCYLFSIGIIKLTDSLPSNQSSKVIADQVIRSSTSSGANLTEAQASSSRLEFKRFHEIALKSGNETKYWLSLIKDLGKIEEDKLIPLLNELT